MGEILPNSSVVQQSILQPDSLVAQITDLSNRKSIKLIFRTPLSSYHDFPMSFRMMILGNESPVKLKGFNSAACFSASGMANADWI
jgi:hypothetical protein